MTEGASTWHHWPAGPNVCSNLGVSASLSPLLRELVTPASSVAVGAGSDQVLPVDQALQELLPHRGLRRGGVVAVAPAPGATSLLLALLARASREGAWTGLVGRVAGELGVLAAAELGAVADHLVLVPDPGVELLRVIGILADGLEVVVVGGGGRDGGRDGGRGGLVRVTPRQAQRMASRLRQRGAALLVRGTWPGADVVLRPTVVDVDGLGEGRGRLRGRRLLVEATGRALPRPRRLALAPPAPVRPRPRPVAATVAGPVAGSVSVRSAAVHGVVLAEGFTAREGGYPATTRDAVRAQRCVGAANSGPAETLPTRHTVKIN